MVSVAEAAAALGLSPTRVRQLIRGGRLPAERVGKAYVVDEDSLWALKAEPRPAGRPRLVINRGSLVWDAASDAILGLGQAEANRFLASLTGAELHRLGLSDPVHRYSHEERAGDGGCDLLLQVPTDLQHPYIPGGTSVWQVKSGKRAPDAADEIDSPKHAFLRTKLAQGAAYVLVCTQSFTPDKQERILAAFRERVHAINEASDVRLLMPSDLAKWSLNHPSVIRRLGRHLTLLNDWQQWDHAIRGEESLPFIDDEMRKEFIINIRAWVGGNLPIGSHVHIFGPSGVGKSRLALEAFDTPNLRDQVVFVDSPDRASAILLDELIESTHDLGTIVVDNCDFDEVERLQSLATRAAGKLRLITVGGLAGLSKSRPTSTYWRLKPLQAAPMVEALQRALSLDGDQAVFVATVTEGYPRLAWLLGRRLRDGSIASLADFSARSDTAAVLGALVPAEKDRLHLGALALFTRVGADQEWRVELDAVCRAFELRVPEVLRTVNHHPDLVQHFGRFVQVTPGLVCAWLISELISDYGVETLMRWVAALPTELQERFAAQIGVLGEDATYGPLADVFLQSIDLAKPQTEWGDGLRAAASLDHLRAARWLVKQEQADSENFYRAFSDVRTNYLFEHLLWFEDSFSTALGMLFRLALRTTAAPSRSEPQAMLGGVFLTVLGGTAVPYARRVAELRRLIHADGSNPARIVGIHALLAGLSHFQGRSAPSLQGGTVRPAEWRPRTYAEDHEARLLVWKHLMELIDGVDDEGERERFWLNVIEGLGQLAHVLDPDVWLSAFEERQWSTNLRIKLRHGLSLVSRFDALPGPTRDRVEKLCARLGPPADPFELTHFLLSGEPYELSLSFGEKDSDVQQSCAILGADMADDPAVFRHVLDAASRARVSTVGRVFEEFAKCEPNGGTSFTEITSAVPVTPLAVAGYLSGSEARGHGQWVTDQLTRVPEAIAQALMAVNATEERAERAIEAAATGRVEWPAIAGPLLLRPWRETLTDEQFAQLIGQLLLAKGDGNRRAALAGLDDWSEYHSDLPEPLLDLIERVLLATAGDVDAMVTFHRRRLMHRVPVTFETRLAVTLTVARTRYEDQAELTALFGPLIRSGGMQALRDVFDAINRERETLSWSPLDHNVRGGHLLSLAADELGVEPVWQFIERGGIGKASLMNHVDMATEEPSDLAVRILESAPAEVRHSAADAFIEHRGASYGRLSDAYARDRDRASRWSATSSSPQVRDWAQEVAAAIDASLPFYRQRDEEFG